VPLQADSDILSTSLWEPCRTLSNDILHLPFSVAHEIFLGIVLRILAYLEKLASIRYLNSGSRKMLFISYSHIVLWNPLLIIFKIENFFLSIFFTERYNKIAISSHLCTHISVFASGSSLVLSFSFCLSCFLRCCCCRWINRTHVHKIHTNLQIHWKYFFFIKIIIRKELLLFIDW